MQPKKKSDCLVHNIYIVQCHLRPAQQKSVHLDLMHVQASSRRGNKFSVLKEWMISGRQRSPMVTFSGSYYMRWLTKMSFFSFICLFSYLSLFLLLSL